MRGLLFGKRFKDTELINAQVDVPHGFHVGLDSVVSGPPIEVCQDTYIGSCRDWIMTDQANKAGGVVSDKKHDVHIGVQTPH